MAGWRGTGQPGRRRTERGVARLVPLLTAGLLTLPGCTGGSHAVEPALLSPTLSVPSPSAARSSSATAGPHAAGAAALPEPVPPAYAEPAPAAASSRWSAEGDQTPVGTLAAGFPVELLPVPADGAILVTSAVPLGDAQVQEVSLNVQTGLDTAEVLALYRAALLDGGFTEVPPASSPDALTAESLFTRSDGDELVSVGVLDADGTRTVTVGGRIHTSR